MTDARPEPFLPAWMWAIVAIEVLVPTFFGVATVIDPSIWGADTLDAFGKLYVTRNLTMVLGVVLATFMRSRLALFVAITARYVTDLVDIIDGFVSGPGGDTTVVLAVFTVVLLVVPAFGLNWLRTRLRGGSGAQAAARPV